MIIRVILIIWLSAMIDCAGKQTPEFNAVANIVRGIQRFQQAHNGTPPSNWAELATTLNLREANDSLLGTSHPDYPVQEHYVFVHQKIGVPLIQGGDALLIRAAPVKYSKEENGRIIEGEEGRFVISILDGKSRWAWLPEKEVQGMFQKAGVETLSEPDPSNETNPSSQIPHPTLEPSTPTIPRANLKPHEFSSSHSTNQNTSEVMAVSETGRTTKWILLFLIVVAAIAFLIYRRSRSS